MHAGPLFRLSPCGIASFSTDVMFKQDNAVRVTNDNDESLIMSHSKALG